MILRLIIFLIYLPLTGNSQKTKNDVLYQNIIATMKNASRFMDEEVSVNGGYVRLYKADLSRRWGELEFYKTQIQVQSYGVVSMGNLFLDAYEVTKDEYYYELAQKAAEALIMGQLPCGGWNYMIDFGGDRSLKNWYQTIGKNAWGFEEFYHYYGNATFDDVTTSDAGKFLLRIYLQKLNPKYKFSLDKVINLLLESQYPAGGWPQRYPLKYDFPHGFETDYTSFLTFNDDVTWGNLEFLIQCYAMLNEERLSEPIQRGMNFFIITQQGAPQAGWGLQYNLSLKPDHGRSYEPAALSTLQTFENVLLLIHFYKLTGDKKFLNGIPSAIKWLEDTRLPDNMTKSGKRTHALFIEVDTNRNLWAHRRGTGVNDQRYWVDHDTTNLYSYGDNTNIDIDLLKREYAMANALSDEKATLDSPLKVREFQSGPSAGKYYQEKLPWERGTDFARMKKMKTSPTEKEIKEILNSLDKKSRWISKHEWISNPYQVLSDGTESNTAMLADEIHANWIVDSSDEDYISTKKFQENMHKLIAFLSFNYNH